jgi:hypothetical protein
MDAKVRDVMTPGPIGVGAPVATPLSWPEVDDAGLEPGQFTMATIGARLGARRTRGRASPAPGTALARRESASPGWSAEPHKVT